MKWLYIHRIYTCSIMWCRDGARLLETAYAWTKESNILIYDQSRRLTLGLLLTSKGPRWFPKLQKMMNCHIIHHNQSHAQKKKKGKNCQTMWNIKTIVSFYYQNNISKRFVYTSISVYIYRREHFSIVIWHLLYKYWTH